MNAGYGVLTTRPFLCLWSPLRRCSRFAPHSFRWSPPKHTGAHKYCSLLKNAYAVLGRLGHMLVFSGLWLKDPECHADEVSIWLVDAKPLSPSASRWLNATPSWRGNARPPSRPAPPPPL